MLRLRDILTSGVRVIPFLLGLTRDIILSCEQSVDLAGETVKEVALLERANGL